MTGEREGSAMAGVDPWRYILSAGRTGTVFLETFLKAHCPGVTAVHEPSPTRELMMLANFRNQTGIGKRLLARQFERGRRARAAANPGAYVEINPFLCAMTDLLPGGDRPLRIVHMVREPGSWTASMLGFKASTQFRNIVDLIPFANPYPSPRPSGWRQLSHAEKTLWRWHWCNSRIMALKSQTPHYCLVRYEDLFTTDTGRQESALRNILQTLGLDSAGPVDSAAFSERRNPAAAETEPPDPAIVKLICGDLAAQLGYAD